MVIPDSIYAECEKWLRGREGLIEQAQRRLERAREAAYAARAAAMDKNGGRGSQDGSGLERMALRVAEAEEQLRRALSWDDVFVRLDRMLPVESMAGKVGRYLYQRGMTQKYIADLLGCDRQTVRRYQDDYVVRCALLAVQAGLITIAEDETQAERRMDDGNL